LDIDPRANVLVVTSECQPLLFFDVPTLLDHARTAAAASTETHGLALGHELAMMQEICDLTAAVSDAQVFQNTVSWRITAPLRRVRAAFRRRGPRS
jgi:hypothetical protein